MCQRRDGRLITRGKHCAPGLKSACRRARSIRLVLMKRGMDIAGAGFGLLFFAPVMIAIALLIRCRMGAPVLFGQTRAGRDATPFQMIKFRTMRDAVDADGRPLPDA